MTNSHAIGIEAEGANEKWPAAQYDAYVRLVRALLDEFDLPTSRALRHAETCSPAGRKVDASFNGDQVDTNEGDSDPRVDHDALVENPVEYVDKTGSARCALNSHFLPTFPLSRLPLGKLTSV